MMGTRAGSIDPGIIVRLAPGRDGDRRDRGRPRAWLGAARRRRDGGRACRCSPRRRPATARASLALEMFVRAGGRRRSRRPRRRSRRSMRSSSPGGIGEHAAPVRAADRRTARGPGRAVSRRGRARCRRRAGRRRCGRCRPRRRRWSDRRPPDRGPRGSGHRVVGCGAAAPFAVTASRDRRRPHGRAWHLTGLQLRLARHHEALGRDDERRAVFDESLRDRLGRGTGEHLRPAQPGVERGDVDLVDGRELEVLRGTARSHRSCRGPRSDRRRRGGRCPVGAAGVRSRRPAGRPARAS